jgi:molybdopterin-guanine dinucleotide biosynthesis protein A
MPFSGIVLNGGTSSRMGRDKGEIIYQGKTLLSVALNSLIDAEADEIFVVGGDKPRDYPNKSITLLNDLFPNEGPLGGVITGLRSVKNEIAVILACDYLDTDGELVKECISFIGNNSMVFPVYKNSRQFLFSAIRTNVCSILEKHFANGVRSMHQAVAHISCETYEPSRPEKLRSANTPYELNE